MMDLFNSKQQELKENNISINLYTGRLLYEYYDLSMGINSYQINLSHVYNSKLELPSGLDTHMSKNWKLNVQEYLYSTSDGYYYVDSYGRSIKFKQYSVSTYFDIHGLGLILTIGTTENIISDLKGNKKYFQNNKLVQIVSCENTSMIQKFQYDGNKLTKIWDTRNQSNYIQLYYNSDQLLEEIYLVSGTTNELQIRYYYDENKQLKYIEKERKGIKKYVEAFGYYSKYYLNKVANLTTKMGAEFTYSANKANTFTIGKMTFSTLTKKDYSYCLGSDDFVGDGIYLGDEMDEMLSIVPVGIDTDNILEKYTISYSSLGTTVKTLKNIIYEYYHDMEGNTAAVFEKASIYDSNLKTISKSTGIPLLSSGTHSDSINGINAYEMTSNVVLSSATEALMAENLTNVSEFIKKTSVDNHNNEWDYQEWMSTSSVSAYLKDNSEAMPYYVCKFWLKLLDYFVNPKVTITVKGKNENEDVTTTSTVQFEGINNLNVWQFVQIPFSVTATEITSIEIKFSETESKALRITDVVIANGIIPKTKFYDNSSSFSLDEVTQIKIYEQDTEDNYEVISIGSDIKFTELDINLTHQHMMRLKLNSSSNPQFPLFFNEGKDFVAVARAVLYDKNNNISEIYAYYDDEENKYTFKYYKDNTYSISQTYYSYDESTAQYYICESVQKILNGEIYENITKYDLKGKIVYSLDDHNIEKTYSYDQYGNKIEEKVKNKNSDVEQLINTYTFEKDNETSCDGRFTTVINYDDALGYVKSQQIKDSSGNVIESYNYEYDSFNEKIKKIYTGTKEHYINYDEYGNMLESFTTKHNVSNRNCYRFGYDIFNDPSELYIVNGKNKTKISETIRDRSSNTITTKIYDNNNVLEQYTEKFDNYGNLLEGENNNLIITKEENKESAGLSNIVKIVENSTGITHNYSYDEAGNLSEYNVKDIDGDKFTEYKGGHNIVLYLDENSDGTDNYISYLLTDYDKNINSRVNSTRFVLGSYSDVDDLDFITNYGYDNLGRIATKKTVTGYVSDVPVKLNKTYSYLPNSNVLNSIIIQLGQRSQVDYDALVNPVNCSFTNTYDNKGNISTIVSSIGGTNYQHSYVYDDINQLEKDVDLNATYLYSYDEFGNILSVIKSNTDGTQNKKEYSYTNNRLTSFKGYSDSATKQLIYDDYGLLKSCGNKTYTWNKGQLLNVKESNNLVSTYEYNAFGQRTKKILPGDNVTKYFYDTDGKLIVEKRVEKYNNSDLYRTIRYMYDLEGLSGFQLSQSNATLGSFDRKYYYIKDSAGNYVGIAYNDKIVVKYDYDAYGNVISVEDTSGIDLATLNPFRWKGYYYDEETSLFWLSSRYYSPELCRFISPDDIEYLDPESVNGLNLYCYCKNNPIMYADPSGHIAISTLLIISAIITGVCVVGGAAMGGVSAGMSGGDVGDVFAGIGKGALNGLIFGGGISLAVCGLGIGGTTIIGSIMTSYGLSISANMLEVAITQGKKSYYDGDSFWAGANDINRAMFANSGNILIGKPTLMSIPFYGTRMTSKIPTIFNVYASYELDKLFDSTPFLASAKATLLGKASTLGLIAGYGLTALQYYNLIRAIVTTPDFENSPWILY